MIIFGYFFIYLFYTRKWIEKVYAIPNIFSKKYSKSIFLIFSGLILVGNISKNTIFAVSLSKYNHKMPVADTIFRMFVAGKMTPFYERYYPGMLMYASRLLGNELEWMADDCVSDAVMDAFQKRHTFHDAEQWRAHILACIRNKAVSALRRLSAMRNYLGSLDSDYIEDDATRALIEHEVLDALYSAIEELPAQYRTILRMSFEEGLRNAEIAARLGVAEITVKKRKARMLDLLRTRLSVNIDLQTLGILLTAILLESGK